MIYRIIMRLHDPNGWSHEHTVVSSEIQRKKKEGGVMNIPWLILRDFN